MPFIVLQLNILLKEAHFQTDRPVFLIYGKIKSMIVCQFENGNKANLRHLCVNVILVKDKKVLLGKRGRYQGRKIIEFGKWSLIGGFLDRDETLEKGLQREVLEEAGWQINGLKLFRINDNPDRPGEDRQNVDVIFIARAVKKIKQKKSQEITKLQWFAIDNLPSKEEIAFDHDQNLELYQQYLVKRFKLPLLG